MNAEEKRIYPRAEIRWPVSAITANGTIRGGTKDISMRGAFISCSKPLYPNERFLLTISGPSCSMQVVAQVVWSISHARDDEKSLNGMGVSFIWSMPTT